MFPLPPRSHRTDSLFPYPTLFRSYPATLDKVVNSTNWIGIRIMVNDVELDLATGEVLEFERVLHMKEGYLERRFQVKLPGGGVVAVQAVRFCSIVDDRSEEHTSELQSLMRISYAVFCLKKKT